MVGSWRKNGEQVEPYAAPGNLLLDLHDQDARMLSMMLSVWLVTLRRIAIRAPARPVTISVAVYPPSVTLRQMPQQLAAVQSQTISLVIHAHDARAADVRIGICRLFLGALYVPA